MGYWIVGSDKTGYLVGKSLIFATENNGTG